MTTADVHILAGAYALEAVDDLERAAFVRHLSECSACADEVAGFRETAALLGTAAAASPDDDFRRRVLVEISQTRQLPPLVPAEAAVPARRSPWHKRAWIGIVAVAAVAAVLVGGISIGVDQSVPGSPVPVAAGAVTSAPDATTVRATVAGGGSVSATVSRQLGKVLIAAHSLPALDVGHAYEVWLTGPGAPRSAGLVGPGGGTIQAVLPAETDGVSVTVEPATGSLQPTTPSVADLAVG
ncbi:anti-sigma factor [Amycolatopsis eburnea]|uniref:Regulator of SigK n=1 Tax=Amycolatopsis eburnea TaxID=2267691 RepID=A0A3R9F381_9PSEU|nr:anti-sigma factor [Amycolatopsis eburnea]RSD13615.1 hypothetical protein EIY87_28355 [Amycolatopsis eburnea]